MAPVCPPQRFFLHLRRLRQAPPPHLQTSSCPLALAPRYRSDLLNTPHLRSSAAGRPLPPPVARAFKVATPTLTARAPAWTGSRDASLHVSLEPLFLADV